MTNIITQKHLFDNDKNMSKKKSFPFGKLFFGGQGLLG
jgi:hypothetical protein